MISTFLTDEDYARLCHYQDIIDLMRSAPSIATWDAGNNNYYMHGDVSY